MDFLAFRHEPFDRRCAEIFLSRFGFLAVTHRFCAATDVQNDFVQARDLHVVLVARTLPSCSANAVLVFAFRRGV